MWRLVMFLTDTTTTTPTTTPNDGVSELLKVAANLVDTVVLPAIYVILGLVLLIKGTLLGVQIVKSADEPQVRQEKINSLKWLVIGVVVAFSMSLVVDLLIGEGGENMIKMFKKD